MKPIIIVQGSQWGSEGKGMVAGALCRTRQVKFAVRTGAVNAGHTVYRHGQKYVMQQLPVGWVAGDDCTLVIGAGAYVNPEILRHEITMVREAGYRGDILIDRGVGVHLPEHTERSGVSGRHYKIGATGKGCSEAIIDRIKGRGDSQPRLLRDVIDGNLQILFHWVDSEYVLNSAYDDQEQILLEGTQGNMLDLYYGPYPFTTHKQTLASQWVTEAGLSPALDYEIVSVVRTYPIRVAGNSGPMPQEITWWELANIINEKRTRAGMPPIVGPEALVSWNIALNSFPPSRYATQNVWKSEHARDAWNLMSEEHRAELAKLFEFTTVTKKLRRIARLDMPSLHNSLRQDRPAWIALTFFNYEFPDIWGAEMLQKEERFSEYLDLIRDMTGYVVGAVTTGPDNERHFLDNFSG